MNTVTSTEICSTCPYCGVGCGVLLSPDGAGGLSVRGDPAHPANRGRLCSKGSALAETVGLDERLLDPVIHGQPADWETALDHVAGKFRETIDQHGPDSVAFYVSGQLLTEDYYVANKLMKGFIGSANIDTNSRLCMASTVAGHKRAFGTDTVPGVYEDLEEADLIVLVGSNLAWCHPVLYQRILAARVARPDMKIIVIDPRRTASCDGADLHLALRSGGDVALFNGLLAEIDRRGALDHAYLDAHVDGARAAIDAASAADTGITALSADDLERFYDMWIGTEKTVTIFSQGVNQSSSGADKVNAILNCHLATGRIGKPGMGPFSVTGQPNAMGGREVGGLANMLACHLDIENGEHRDAVGRFWKAPHMPDAAGLKAVDMFEAVREGTIKALWIIHTNPAVTLPDANNVRDAIANCPFTVVSDVSAKTDTARLADIVLPATAWAEKSGTVTNSDRTISRQRRVLPAPGNARDDWRILCEVARRMGFEGAFDYDSPAAIFREYAALSAIAGDFGRDFDISGHSDISDAGYEALAPFKWPYTRTRQGGRFFANGGFYHADGRARMLALSHRDPASQPSAQYPYRLNTGRIRDQWHTMTRTGLSPRLSAHLAEPFIDIHPYDAQALSIKAGDLVQAQSPFGEAILRARITEDVQKGDVFVPIHWTGETAPSARIDVLVAPVVDPVSGQPESKASVTDIRRYDAKWHGFAVSQKALSPDCTYWARARTQNGFRAELAGEETPQDWEAFARELFSLADAPVQSMADARRGINRFAFYDGDTLIAALYTGCEPVALMRDYLAGLPGTPTSCALAGIAGADVPDPGPIVCSCFSVGKNTINTAICEKNLQTVEAIGETLSAGTNCGSCKPELAALLRTHILENT